MWSGQAKNNQNQLDMRALELAMEAKNTSADTRKMWEAHVKQCELDRAAAASRDEKLGAAISQVATDVAKQTNGMMRWAIGTLCAAVAYFLVTNGLPGHSEPSTSMIQVSPAAPVPVLKGHAK